MMPAPADRPVSRAQFRRRKWRLRKAECELGRQLSALGVKYCRVDNNSGAAWFDETNRGAPQFLIPVPPPNAPGVLGLAILLKAGKWWTVSPAQEAWMSFFRRMSWRTVIAHGVDEALEEVERLGYGEMQ